MDNNNVYYTLGQLKENNGDKGKMKWVLINGSIYDVTDFRHPGGFWVFTEKIGEDRIDDFKNFHGKYSRAHHQLDCFYIGKLKK